MLFFLEKEITMEVFTDDAGEGREGGPGRKRGRKAGSGMVTWTHLPQLFWFQVITEDTLYLLYLFFIVHKKQ